MAKLCKQVPPAGKGDTVFPTSTSPAALRASTGEDATAIDVPDAPDERPERIDIEARPDKPPPAPVVPVLSVSAAPDVAAR